MERTVGFCDSGLWSGGGRGELENFYEGLSFLKFIDSVSPAHPRGQYFTSGTYPYFFNCTSGTFLFYH